MGPLHYFAESVLSIFLIIRGFADLHDLVAEIPSRIKPELIAILQDDSVTTDKGNL